MKSVYGVVLLVSLLALAHAFPGVPKDSDESTEEKNDGLVLVLPNRGIFDEFSDEDDHEPSAAGFWHPFRFDSSPFEGLFTRMQDTMNKMRAEMAAALAGRLGQSGLTPWGKIPEGANTTSTVKVIGDHKVTINETTYSDGDENGGTVFRVRVVDVKPLAETTEPVGTEASSEEESTSTPTVDKNTDEANSENNREELTTPASRSVETVEEFDNEIPKNQIETLTA